MAEHIPERPDGAVLWVTGEAMLSFHVLDQEAIYDSYPPLTLPALVDPEGQSFHSGEFHAIVKLPKWALRPAQDVPAPHCEWTCADEEYLLISLESDSDLPRRRHLHRRNDGHRMAINGRPFQVQLVGDPGSARCAAAVIGFLTDAIQLTANIVVKDPARREQLLVGLTTLRTVGGPTGA